MTTCENCDGDGEYFQLANCTVYRNDCCGGCGEMVECEECNGSGEVEEEY